MSTLFAYTNCLDDLNRAILAYWYALRTPFSKANEEVRGRCLFRVTTLHLKRYKLTKDVTELDFSAKAAMKAVKILPETNPELASDYCALRSALESLAKAKGDDRDIERALEDLTLHEMFLPGGWTTDMRIASVHRATTMLSRKEGRAEASRVRDTAIDLAPRAGSRSLLYSKTARVLLQTLVQFRFDQIKLA